ncbi:MAG: TonB family protein [Gammaproteobacteria bacterium]|nr:TonB family protein [Gammaproteobacteria bacterium]
MIARYTTSLGLGASVTFALLLFMHILIAARHGPLPDRIDLPRLDFVRIERTPPPVESRRAKPSKPDPALPPPDVPTSSDDGTGNGVEIRTDAPAVPLPDVDIRRSTYVDGDLLSLVKVEPSYPARAAAGGIEGYVVVEFTVTRHGLVEDVVVVESTNDVFDRAAVDAALKFRYKPRVIDGEPVDVRGVRNKITFKLRN